MQVSLKMEKPYLGLPVNVRQNKTLLEIFDTLGKQYELTISDLENGAFDYYCWIRIPNYAGRRLILKGNLSAAFFEQIRQAEKVEYDVLLRPLLHFTAERGWLNDPNGLIYHNGIYHLYFQHNPTGTQWDNMSWGHAVSKDLLHFQQQDTVLFPDEYGAVFSGNGLVNERGLLGLPNDAFLFFYTAAGGVTPWSDGRAYTQRMAVSVDGGRVLDKLPEEVLGVIGQESRDPQVFWHETSNAYIMILWIQDEEMALFRSENLQDWMLSDRFSLPGAYECPNLFPMSVQDEEMWVLIAADGTYYTGIFDGWHFQIAGSRKKCYLNSMAYAAQIYSGIKDRTVLIAWLRTGNAGRLYTGMMGLPRELSLTMRNGEPVLRMRPVREYEDSKKRLIFCERKGENGFVECSDGQSPTDTSGRSVLFHVTEEAVTELILPQVAHQELEIEFFGQMLVVKRDELLFENKHTVLSEDFYELHLLIDRQVIEIYGNDYTQTAYYETGSDVLTGTIRITGCTGMPEVYQWK